MTLTDLEQYVFAYFLAHGAEGYTSTAEYRERGEFVTAVEDRLFAITEGFGPGVHSRYPAIAENFVDAMIESRALKVLSDRFAGTFYNFDQQAYNKLVSDLTIPNEIVAKAKNIGHRFWVAAFSNLASDPERVALPSTDLIEIPASDRIVLLNDNSRESLRPVLDDVISEVEGLNGEPSARELQGRIAGQLKAGRELLNATSFRAYALYVTLVTALVELTNRYRDSVVGNAAYDLLKLLALHVYQVGQ